MSHQSHSQNTHILYALLRLFSTHFSCPTNQSSKLVYSHTLTNYLSTSPCLLYTLPITHILICSTQCYRVMSAVELSKVSTAVTNVNFRLELVQTVFSSISGSISSYQRERISWNIEWFLRNFIQFPFKGLMNFQKYVIIPNKSSVYIKRVMTVYRYIVLVKSWYCLSRLYPELTRFYVHFFPVSSSVPIYCIAMHRNVMLCPVEHRKLRIRHNLLCLKI